MSGKDASRRERINARQRERYDSDPAFRARKLAQGRRSYDRHREKKCAQGRERYAASASLRRSKKADAKRITTARRKRDPAFRLRVIIAGRINNTLKGRQGCGALRHLGLNKSGTDKLIADILALPDAGRQGYHLDHIIPFPEMMRRYDGDHIAALREWYKISNLRWIPAEQNLRKGDRVETLV